MVTPITSSELILGNTIPFAVLGMIELGLALVAVKIVYAIPIAGSLVLFLGLSLLFIFSTLGLGILISTASHTQQQALFLAWFVIIFCILMSGFMLPIENMPPFIRTLTYIDPLRYYLVITREVFLKGAGLMDLWKEALSLAVFAAVLITAAVIRFNRRIG
jgi:ABC-2 type transport system permease protein